VASASLSGILAGWWRVRDMALRIKPQRKGIGANQSNKRALIPD